MRTMWDDYCDNQSDFEVERIISETLENHIKKSEVPGVIDTDPTVKDADGYEIIRRMSLWCNELSERTRTELTYKIHEYLKNGGSIDKLPVTMFHMVTLETDSDHKYPLKDFQTNWIHYYFHYFGPSYPTRPIEDGKHIKFLKSEFIEHDVNQKLGLTIFPKLSFINNYDNKDIVFDKKYDDYKKQLINHKSRLLSAEKNLEDSKKELQRWSMSECIISALGSILKIAFAAGIGVVAFLVICSVCNSLTIDAQIGVVLGIIAGIIILIVCWNKWEIGDGFMDFGFHSSAKKSFDYNQKQVNNIKARISTLENSEEYKKAKESDDRLRKEDMEFAKKWHMAWFEKCMKSQLTLHFSKELKVIPEFIMSTEERKAKIEYEKRINELIRQMYEEAVKQNEDKQ